MTDEGTPPGPPRFPPVDEPRWPSPSDAPPGYGPPSYGTRPPHGLHPLDVGRAFGTALRLYRLHWPSMLGAYAALLLPLNVVFAVFEAVVVFPWLVAWQTAWFDAFRRNEVPSFSFPLDLFLLAVVLGFAALIAVAIAGLVATAAVTYIVDSIYRGRPIGALEGLRAAFRRTRTLVGLFFALIFGLIGVGLVGILATAVVAAVLGVVLRSVGLAVFAALIGYVGTVVAMIFVALRWGLALQAAICEQLGAVQSLRRSWRLVAGSTWRLLGYSLLFAVIGLIVSLLLGVISRVFQRVLSPSSLNLANPFEPSVINPLVIFVQALISTVGTLVITPWWLAVLTLLYYDLRWRQGEAVPYQSAVSGASLAPEGVGPGA